MGLFLTAIYLVLVGIAALLTVNIPLWVFGLLALLAGIVLLVETGLPYVRR